jgi:hypothetical protein
MVTGFRVVVAIAFLLLIVAVRAVFVGYDSYTPVLFGQLYIGLVGVLLVFPTLLRTGRSAASDHPLLQFVAAAVGALLFSMVAPQIGEPNYCGQGDLLYETVRVPTVYRCTSEPLLIAGWFAGWWMTIWIMDWWAARIGVDSDGVPVDPERSPPWIGAVVVFATGLLILAVGKLFVGSSSFRPIVFAQIYICLATLFFAAPTLLRAEQSGADLDWYLLFGGALVGAVVFWNVAPEIGGPNYCMPLPRGLRVLRDMTDQISRDVGVTPPAHFRPKVFRCTNLPFAIVGGFAGWWLVLWWSVRRKSG